MGRENVYVGTGGWDLSPFDGKFYPARRDKSFRKLEFYAHFFDTVEVNATFYNTSFSPAQIRRWLEDVSENKRFIFTVKLFHGFTHTFDATKEDALAVSRLLDILGEKFGGLLIQFPSSFSNERGTRGYLQKLAEAFGRYRMFLEVRHKSWNGSVEFFQERGFHPVNVDLPQIGVHMPFTTLAWDGAAYFRLMGRNGKGWRSPWRVEDDGKHAVSDRYHYLYPDNELREVLGKVRTVAGASNLTFVVFHNDPGANSLYNGFRLRRFLNPSKKLLVPRRTLEAFPALREIAGPA